MGAAGGGAAVGGSGGDLVPLAKPPVRKLARDLGVDLRAVTGTGAGGVITREDVEAFAGRPVASGVAAARGAASGGERREPIRGVRKATAAAMVASAFTAPHVTEFLAVDVTATMELRARLRASREYTDVPLTPLAFVAKAVCLAARRTPEINAHWDEAAGEIVYYDRMQLGIAAATPRGLIVPKIRDADTLSLRELAVELHALAGTARAGRTPPADLVGGTFTITNVGVFGVDTGTPILNPGEAAILAVGAIKQAPWVVDGQLAVRTVGTARAVVRPPPDRRRAGLAVPGRRRRAARRSRAGADLVGASGRLVTKRHRVVTGSREHREQLVRYLGMPFVLLYLVIEIVALVALGSAIGVWWTLLVLAAGSVLGLWLARREGVRAAQAIATAVTNRQVAHVELTDGLLVAAGGVLLFIPGLVTDLAGLLLLLPPIRALIRRRLVRAAEERAPELRTARIRARGPVVDGEVVDAPPADRTGPTPLIIEADPAPFRQDRAS